MTDSPVTVRVVESPIGPLLLAATDLGLVRVAFEREGFDEIRQSLATHDDPDAVLLEDVRSSHLQAAATELSEYFDSRRRNFTVPLDRSASTGFRATVQALLPEIPYGQTRTYAELAALAGRPTATRAVGTACGTNPLPIVVPCHRVLRSDGSLGGYLGGLDAKQWLLDLEREALIP